MQQVVGKALRFGLFDHHPGTGEQNWASMVHEVHDVVAVYEMLCEYLHVPCRLEPVKIKAKKVRVIKRMKQCGVIK